MLFAKLGPLGSGDPKGLIQAYLKLTEFTVWLYCISLKDAPGLALLSIDNLALPFFECRPGP